MILKLIKLYFLILCFPVLANNEFSDLESNFQEVFYEYKDCNEEYLNFSNSKKHIKSFLNHPTSEYVFEISKITKVDIDTFQQLIKSRCNPEEIFLNTPTYISNIFNSQSQNKDFLLSAALNLVPIAIVFNDSVDTQRHYDFLGDIFSLVNKNVNKLVLNGNWAYSISSLYNSILHTSALGFSELNNENQSYANFLLFTNLESLIFKSLTPNFTDESLTIIAETLMMTRISKLEEHRFFGSSDDEYIMKEQFLNIYLNNYDKNKIKYNEFSLYDLSLRDRNIYLEIGLDSVDRITNLLQDKKTSALTSESEIRFAQIIFNILADKFYEDPYLVLENSIFGLNLISMGQIDTCPFMNKEINIENSYNYYSKVATLDLLKSSCHDDTRYFNNALSNLLKGLNLVENNSIDITIDISLYDDKSIYVEDSMILSLTLVQYILNSEDLSLDSKFIDLLFSVQEEALAKIKPTSINNSEGFIYLGLFETISMLVEDISAEYVNFKQRSDNFLETVFLKFPIDAIAMKEELIVLIGQSNPDQINDIFMSARLTQWYLKTFILKYYDLESYLWPEKIVNDITKTDFNDKKLENIFNNLDLLTFIIDNLDNIFKGPDYFLFIFKDQSLDKWYLFRELVPIEIYTKYTLFLSNKISFDEYTSLSEKRFNQLLKIRPNNIALQKFREDLIDNDFYKPLRDVLIEYDNLHNEFLRYKEEQYIMTNYFQQSRSQRNSEYILQNKIKLQNVESILFSIQDEDLFASLFSFESHDLKHFQNSLKYDEMMISPVMSPDGTFGYINYVSKDNITVIPFFEPINIYADILINDYKNPNSDNYLWLASNLYYNLLNPIEEILGTKAKRFNDIFIIPDPSIKSLPYHALYDYDENKWSIEKYNFKYLSSEKLYLYLDNQKISKNQRFVGIGNPSLNKKSIQSDIEKFLTERSEIGITNIKELYELPETEDELTNISKFFKSKVLFFQDDAKELLIHNEHLKISDVLAFATHTIRGIDINAAYSDRGLVFTPGYAGSGDDGFVGSLDISDINFKSSPFVMLSACNTIDSPYYESLPFSGLAKSFMKAGANSVLMSLWNIDSISAKRFNESIFNKYFFTTSFFVSDSIQDSMIEMIESRNYSHPYYWAPYTYLGK